MKIIKAGYQIINPDIDDPNGASKIYKMIERAGRTCYKSEDKITDDSAEKFVRGLIKRGHEAMIEHASMTVVFTTDRGVSHEIVRHRIASFAQESTRYCNYSGDKFDKEVTFIRPCFFDEISEERAAKIIHEYEEHGCSGIYEQFSERERQYIDWYYACICSEESYFGMLKDGATPQEARSVLSNSLKTEIVVTMNMREWRHFLKLRAARVSGKPHPQMLEIAVPLLNELRLKLPAIFDDIEPMQE